MSATPLITTSISTQAKAPNLSGSKNSEDKADESPVKQSDSGFATDVATDSASPETPSAPSSPEDKVSPSQNCDRPHSEDDSLGKEEGSEGEKNGSSNGVKKQLTFSSNV